MRIASFRSGTSSIRKPPSCSFVSANGPSITSGGSESLRSVVAAVRNTGYFEIVATPSEAGAEALIAAEPSAIDHLNADHADTMQLYATRLLGAQAADWRCSGIDPAGLDLQCGKQTLRLEFDSPVTTSAALRDMLKRMADLARRVAAD